MTGEYNVLLRLVSYVWLQGRSHVQNTSFPHLCLNFLLQSQDPACISILLQGKVEQVTLTSDFPWLVREAEVKQLLQT